MTARKQLSMVLPEPLITAIKQRASSRGQSITAYITRLVEQDLAGLAEDEVASVSVPFVARLERVEQRLAKLERQGL